MTPFLRAAMARAEAEREARMATTPPTQLPKEVPSGPPCSRKRCGRPSVREGLCLQHLGGAVAAGLVRQAPRCACGRPATGMSSGRGDPICTPCAEAWSRYINVESKAGRVLKLAARGPVSAQDVAEAVGVPLPNAYALLSRLAAAGRLRKRGQTLPVEYEVAA